ncbi:pilin [Amycolatopsis sp. NPDC059657]|uniref:pilin n=1 Tax=Amycolatopsis sp. NPDC059657 TaxID=3346899 RepID=UPI00366F7472
MTAALLIVATVGPAHAETVQVLAFVAKVEDVFNNIRNWLVGILAGLATVFLTYGGVRYLMAGGDPGEVEKAKTAFKSAGWGYGLAALAPLVVEILKGIVGAA